ncbi:hypothetical protein EW145_g6674 [Phellinidium pouzarii]|uniref:DNA polymerase n=1 Tax=Phellinidium pouzarii TaxID=167371 RepID=A0A4S4KVW1_9AGAM|nr:hypothetical protein EW145_g6674 [Phellinidium pouzarii]
MLSTAHSYKIVGVGEGIARRIDEYLQAEQGVSSQVYEFSEIKGPKEAERERSLSEFQRVPGIGPVKALRLFSAGCRSLTDLQKPEYSSLLSAANKVALTYVDHLNKPVTRADIEAVMKSVVSLVSSEIRMHVVGSYRRGLPFCGNIDVIVLHPSYINVPDPGLKASADLRPSRSSTRRGRSAKHITATRAKQDTILREFILSPLERAGLIAATLSEGPRKWQGIVRVPDGSESYNKRKARAHERPTAFRRMGLTLVPNLSEGAALLAATGDVDFNSHLRGIASNMGLHLNELGLWRRRMAPQREHDGPNSDVLDHDRGDILSKNEPEENGRWELVASSTERDILNALRVDYVEPERRNFTFVLSRTTHGSILKTPSSPLK